MSELKENFWLRLTQVCGTDDVNEIAERIGVGYMTVRNYKNGRVPNAEMLVTIAQHVDVNLNWLLTGTGPQKLSALVQQANTSEHQTLVSPLPNDTFEVEIPATRLRLRLVAPASPADAGAGGEVRTIPVVHMVDEKQSNGVVNQTRTSGQTHKKKDERSN